MTDTPTFAPAEKLVKEFPGPWSFCDSLFVYGTAQPSIELLADTFVPGVAAAIVSIPDMIKEIERLAQENAELRVKLSDLADIAKTRAKKIRELNAFIMRK
jgi:hypothetical protein